jgi:hypothetical protein
MRRVLFLRSGPHRVPFQEFGTRRVPILGFGAHCTPISVTNVEMSHISQIPFIKALPVTGCKVPAKIQYQFFAIICPVISGLLELDYPFADLPICVDQYRIYLPDNGPTAILQ